MKFLTQLPRGIVALVVATGFAAAAPQASPPGVPVKILVTIEPRGSNEIPSVEQQDFLVRQGNDERPVTELTSVEGADTQLMLLIDDSSRGTFGTEIQTLKKFINSLPSNFSVAVGYMRNGMTQLTQNFTQDHASAANSIRLAIGPSGADVSPYDSLTDAARKWPQPGAQRKEVLMISSGIEGLGGGLYPDNPYVNAGISSAVKAGLVVYTIYSPSAGHIGHDMWRNTWGQNFLSELSDATGGESYYLGFGSPVSFQPYLDQFLDAQKHQFLLGFVARPEKKAGLQNVNVSLKNKDGSVAAPSRVFVKASL